eukprot:scaffold37270_cov23-Tisochrysis_lutea.AAC.1
MQAQPNVITPDGVACPDLIMVLASSPGLCFALELVSSDALHGACSALHVSLHCCCIIDDLTGDFNEGKLELCNLFRLLSVPYMGELTKNCRDA